jgi:hypothetical protein
MKTHSFPENGLKNRNLMDPLGYSAKSYLQ